MPHETEVKRLVGTDVIANTAAHTHTGAETHSGAEVFSGAITFTGGTMIHAANITTTGDLSLTQATHAGLKIRTTVKDLDLTLPLASANTAGIEFTMVVGAAATAAVGATLKVTSADKVNGGTPGKGLINSGSTDAVGDSVTVYSDGADWWTIAQRGTWDAES